MILKIGSNVIPARRAVAASWFVVVLEVTCFRFYELGGVKFLTGVRGTLLPLTVLGKRGRLLNLRFVTDK